MALITVIDDDLEFAKNLSRVLDEAGHDVSLLDTTHNAIRHLVRNKPHLVILDIMFPESPVAGFNLARRIRRRPEIRDLPIILLTGVNQEFPACDIDRGGTPVQDFIEKPVDRERLLKAVSRMAAGG